MGWDRDLLEAINPDQPVPILDLLMIIISLLGYMVPYALLGFLVIRPGRRADAAAFWTALLVTEIIVALLKITIDRPRPDDVQLLISFTESPSMPSGHAARAFAGVCVLWRMGNVWRIPMLTFALLTLLSRVYVGAHYPTDVLFGALLGTGIGLVAYATVRWCHAEMGKPPEARSRFFERAFEAGIYVMEIDYLYSLRLVGRLTQEQGARFANVLRVYGSLRLLMPIFMVLFGIVAYALILPDLFGPSATCLGAYFLPIIGIEVGIPLCLAAGLPAWLIVAAIIYFDIWLSLFLILNFDFLHKVPRIGAWLLRSEERGLTMIRKRPWLLRLEFLGVALVTFFPIPGAGIVPGVIVGRFIGLPKMNVWGAVMLGTLARVSLYVYTLAGLLSHLD